MTLQSPDRFVFPYIDCSSPYFAVVRAIAEVAASFLGPCNGRCHAKQMQDCEMRIGISIAAIGQCRSVYPLGGIHLPRPVPTLILGLPAPTTLQCRASLRQEGLLTANWNRQRRLMDLLVSHR